MLLRYEYECVMLCDRPVPRATVAEYVLYLTGTVLNLPYPGCSYVFRHRVVTDNSGAHRTFSTAAFGKQYMYE
eukprot:scaffold344020_cov22-Prasinocladus_malaysianus.AAC.1